MTSLMPDTRAIRTTAGKAAWQLRLQEWASALRQLRRSHSADSLSDHLARDIGLRGLPCEEGASQFHGKFGSRARTRPIAGMNTAD